MKVRKTSGGITIHNFIGEQPRLVSNRYTELEPIASANFGEVYKTLYIPTNTLRCLKIYSKEKIKQTSQNNFEEEIELIRKFDHPNIYKIYEFFQDSKNFYLISEFLAGGELFDFITSGNNYNETTVCIIMEQVLSAVNYLHKHGILHRDLKPENIMLAQKEDIYSIKLIDFGTSIKFKRNQKLSTVIGTCYYIAPEMLNGEYDERIDTWACGVIMYVLMVGYAPFNGKSEAEIFQSILHTPLHFDRHDWRMVTQNAIDLLEKILQKDPNARISLRDIFRHEWFKSNFILENEYDNKELLKRLKTFNSNTKLENAIRIFLIQCFDMNNEKARMVKFFKEADRDHDGMLDMRELKAICKKSKFFFDAETFMAHADVNCDGKINYSEFLMAAIDFKRQNDKQVIIELFKTIDEDGSGCISRDELGKFLNLKADDPLINDIFEEADINNDNKLTIDEFLTDLVNLYSKQ